MKLSPDAIKDLRLSPDAPRHLRLDRLKEFYLHFLVEDPCDGTPLDLDVLDMIEALKVKYKDDQA